MQTKHTPAPWLLRFTGMASTPDYFIRDSEGLSNICTFPETFTNNVEEITANAKLISSAPDMFSTLKKLEEMLYNEIKLLENGKNKSAYLSHVEMLETTRSAINKATL